MVKVIQILYFILKISDNRDKMELKITMQSMYDCTESIKINRIFSLPKWYSNNFKREERYK